MTLTSEGRPSSNASMPPPPTGLNCCCVRTDIQYPIIAFSRYPIFHIGKSQPISRAEDVSFIMKLMREHLKVKVEIQTDQEGRAMVRRLGSKNASKSRSLMITFRPEDIARILKNAKKLAEASNEEIRKIVIKPDQTPFQREEEKKLVKEKNDKNEESKSKNETADWIIQRGRVVRRSQTTRKTTTSTSTTSINEEYRDAEERK